MTITNLQRHAQIVGRKTWVTFYVNGLITPDEFVLGLVKYRTLRFVRVWSLRIQPLLDKGNALDLHIYDVVRNALPYFVVAFVATISTLIVATVVSL